MPYNENNVGYLYILSNPGYKENLYKIGYSNRLCMRIDELYTTSVPSPFEVEFCVLTPNARRIERIIHKRLEEFRFNSNREFFDCSIETIYKEFGAFQEEWINLMEDFRKFLNLGGQYLDDSHRECYIDKITNYGDVYEAAHRIPEVFIKDGEVYYSEVNVCMGTVSEVQYALDKYHEEDVR